MWAAVSDSVVCHLSDVHGRYREHNLDFKKMKLDVAFTPKEGKVNGKINFEFMPIQPLVDSVFLDGPGIQIQKLLVDGKVNNYKSDSAGVTIFFSPALKWNTAHTLEIKYEAFPRKGLYFIGWNDEKNLSRKQIWTQGQGVDNRFWFPCYDDVNDKLISETNITFDKHYTVVSNGKLVATQINNDSTKTWHYQMTKPHSPYLVMIAIDKYAWVDMKSENGVVSRQYYYSDHPETAEPTYRYSKEMMDWMVKETGTPFPWETYSNTPVQDFMFGAMENTTATIYGDFYLLDKRAIIERPYIGTNAHELTHQWFGDYITEWSATHHWLHESFATYYSKQFMHKVMGEDYYEISKFGEAQSAINADKNDRFPVAHSLAGSSRHYPKGSFVIDMLRTVVGDEVFKACIQFYLKKHGYNMVDTHDFYRAFMEKAGINLDWFFEQWIYKSGVPDLTISEIRNDRELRLIIEQTHKKDSLIGNFRLPMNVEIHYTNSIKKTFPILVQSTIDTFTFPTKEDEKIAYLVIDPGYQVLKTIHYSRPYTETLLQARSASKMIDRYQALLSLRDTSLEQKELDLINLYNKESSIYPKQEIISQVAKSKSPQAIQLLSFACSDKEFLVRRAVVDNIDSITPQLLPSLEKLLTDTSYYTIENTLRKLVKQFPENKERYFNLTKEVMGISKNVRIAWIELQCKDSLEKYKNELVDYSSHSYEFRTRTKAMEALGRLNYCDANFIRNLMDAKLNPNSRLAGPADVVFKKLFKTEANKTQAKTYFETTEWKDWEKKILEKLF